MRFILLPVPHEATTSYGKGTKNGPRSILKALQQVEEFDEELGFEPCEKSGVKIEKPLRLSQLAPRVSRIISQGGIPIVIGGEHSITPLALSPIAEKYKNLSVLHFDAHADLRESYEGKKNSHACAMRRSFEICKNLVQVGIRSISKEEYEFARRNDLLKNIHWAGKREPADKIKNQLKENVYISFDVDVFDPSIIPSTGTPEPGGLCWYEVLDILSRVCREKNIAGIDVVELSPIKGLSAPDFTVARLICKMIGYITAARG